jgi:homoserine kinase type II
MAVYTEVPLAQAAALIESLQLGTLTELQGITGGIENTNYFVTTERDGASTTHVLTLFERLTHAQLPFYLQLMKHLAAQGIPVPDPAANAQGEILHTLMDKPAAVVNKLSGRSQLAPGVTHCSAVGAMLARMHLAGQGFELQQPNLRGLPWWNDTVPVVLPHLSPEQATLIRSELGYQNHVAASAAYQALPRGPVHADLFRDNVMFEGTHLTGVIDFYNACSGPMLYDIAITVNDWCLDEAGGIDVPRAQALLAAYAALRPFTAAEAELWPVMLRVACVRFWLSRLIAAQAFAGMDVMIHDPSEFEVRLAHRQQVALGLPFAL